MAAGRSFSRRTPHAPGPRGPSRRPAAAAQPPRDGRDTAQCDGPTDDVARYTLVTDQAFAPAAGLADVTALPFWSTATQRVALAHEMSPNQLDPSTLVTVQTVDASGPLPEVITLPLWSTATQRATVGHETPSSAVA